MRSREPGLGAQASPKRCNAACRLWSTVRTVDPGSNPQEAELASSTVPKISRPSGPLCASTASMSKETEATPPVAAVADGVGTGNSVAVLGHPSESPLRPVALALPRMPGQAACWLSSPIPPQKHDCGLQTLFRTFLAHLHLSISGNSFHQQPAVRCHLVVLICPSPMLPPADCVAVARTYDSCRPPAITRPSRPGRVGGALCAASSIHVASWPG